MAKEDETNDRYLEKIDHFDVFCFSHYYSSPVVFLSYNSISVFLRIVLFSDTASMIQSNVISKLNAVTTFH